MWLLGVVVCRSWIFDGVLLDEASEFFVAMDPSVPDERLWQEKYSINHAMIPPFIGASKPETSLCHRVVCVVFGSACFDLWIVCWQVQR